VSLTTIEVARRCPKCEQPGEKVGERSVTGGQRGAKVHLFECRNARCRWFGQICRAVQVNPDGTIPDPVMKREKQYPTVPDRTQQVNEMLERQLAAERNGSGEVAT
jgi:hypothetical protein